MIEIEHDHADFLVIRASGTLSRSDYRTALPELRNALSLRAARPLRLLLSLEDFHGWDMGALWDELHLDAGLQGARGRIAVVGESRTEAWLTRLSKPFFDAEVQYFDHADRAQAEAWLAMPEEKPV